VFDKTGTLTEGRPSVTKVEAIGRELSGDAVLLLAASVERLSEHPLAQAIVRAASAKNLSSITVDEFVNVAGKGVKARIENASVLVGNPRFMEEEGIKLGATVSQIEAHQARAETVVVVARNGEPVGIIAIADALKSDAKAAIAQLRSEGIVTVMITGDNHKTAEAIARETQIDQFFAEVLPQDKARQVQDFQNKNKRVAFVGDGINDAPALAQADLGIAIGTGTDIAIEAGNIVLVKGSPMKIIEALRYARDLQDDQTKSIPASQHCGDTASRIRPAQSDDSGRCNGALQRKCRRQQPSDKAAKTRLTGGVDRHDVRYWHYVCWYFSGDQSPFIAYRCGKCCRRSIASRCGEGLTDDQRAATFHGARPLAGCWKTESEQ
jgi:P-type E1-E2 ATPase